MTTLLTAAAFGVITAPSIMAQQARLANADWPVYLGDKAATHYSALDQITKANVSRVREAWTFDTKETGEFQANGIVIHGVLYTASTSRKVIALNAATGEHMWTFDPVSERPGPLGRRQRGVTYWASGSGPTDRGGRADDATTQGQRTLWEGACPASTIFPYRR